jgi:hypothetical protein
VPDPESVAVIDGTAILVADSATSFDARHAGGVFVTGSHGGTTAAQFALAAGAKAVLFNDAAVGKGDAGISGLVLAQRHGVPAATVDYRSARIGRGTDTYGRGVISFTNDLAAGAGVRAGMSAERAAAVMARAASIHDRTPPLAPVERRPFIVASHPRIVCVDSASQIDDALVGAIVVTGSHGGAVDGRGVRAAVLGAFFNDAGGGIDDAGVGRLPLLDAAGIAGATVDCWSARIGDGRDTYENGVVSCVNGAARARGWRIGVGVRDTLSRYVKEGRSDPAAKGRVV